MFNLRLDILRRLDIDYGYTERKESPDMNDTITTATDLDITGLYFPRGNDSRIVDWEDLNQDDEGQAYAEAFDFEHDGETFPMVSHSGYVAGVIVNGRVLDDAELDNEITDAEADAEDDGRDADDDPAVQSWRAIRAALDAARDDDPSMWGSDGPMMNYFYPVSDYTRGGGMEDWAAKIADLPVCVVEIGDERGLALTGGGMDLSWEIAEAYVRLGYYPPVWLDLPQMGGRGESAKDRAIASALATHYQAEARRLQRRITELAERYDAQPITD